MTAVIYTAAKNIVAAWLPLDDLREWGARARELDEDTLTSRGGPWRGPPDTLALASNLTNGPAHPGRDAGGGRGHVARRALAQTRSKESR